MVDINYLAVLASAVAAMALGFVWFGPLFGKTWMQSIGITMPSVMTPEMKSRMIRSYGVQAVGSLLMAYIFAHVLVFSSAYLGISGAIAALQGAIWMWLGFVAPVTIGDVLWGTRPWKYWFITAGYYLVLLAIMGLILSYWR